MIRRMPALAVRTVAAAPGAATADMTLAVPAASRRREAGAAHRWCGLSVLVAVLVCGASATNAAERVERWGLFEVALAGPAGGNPFLDVTLSAQFSRGTESIEVAGFYDGNGTYRVRFMPSSEGSWKYVTASNSAQLNGRTGSFLVVAASRRNHGPVHVANTFHFAYADGLPFKEVGTTAYVWHLQTDALQEQTLKTLGASPFNKVRFCVFPKHYEWNNNEPPSYPFEGKPREWNTERFNPTYFQHLEQRVLDLQKLGIEADVILFHPYDKGQWGFDRMTAAEDERYLRYVVARLAALRNVWWSLANEYDLLESKTEDDWERIGELVSRSDPYHHLLSIHNDRRLFNHTRPWITHASIQNGTAVETLNAAGIYRDAYRKPTVYDEVQYEGNIPKRWGSISPEEMVYRFWVGTVAGTYVGHGETYLSPDDVLWWSKGGVLKGESPRRLAFLKRVLEDSPREGIEPLDRPRPEFGGQPSEYYLVYLGKQTPASWEFVVPKTGPKKGEPPQEGMEFKAEVLDTWNMTTTPVEGLFTLKRKSDYLFADKEGRRISLPGRPYMAIRLRRIRSH